MNKTSFTNPETKNPGTILTFTPPITKVVNGINTKITQITIYKIVDDPSAQTVTAFTREQGALILWKGSAYVAIGQWTDSDVQTRVTQILSGTPGTSGSAGTAGSAGSAGTAGSAGSHGSSGN